MLRGKENKVLIFLFGLFIFLVVLSLYLFSLRPIETREFDLLFRVENGRGGFDLNATAFTYGILPTGGKGVREVVIDNKYNFPIQVDVAASGDAAGFVFVSDDIVVQPGENATIPIEIKIPRNASLGNYSGKIEFLTYRGD